MDAEEFLRKAWDAVEKSGVPTELHDTAFREAASWLRHEHSGASPERDRVADKRPGARKPKVRPAPSAPAADPGELVDVDEDAFFGALSHESGVAEDDLRDILSLTPQGIVLVVAPSKDLGGTTSEQARTVTALVASARSKGLNERPVNAEAVREEVKRHGSLDQHYAERLAAMKGFNYGATKKEMLLNSKWVGEFVAAVDLAHSREAQS